MKLKEEEKPIHMLTHSFDSEIHSINVYYTRERSHHQKKNKQDNDEEGVIHLIT